MNDDELISEDHNITVDLDQSSTTNLSTPNTSTNEDFSSTPLRKKVFRRII